MEGRQCRVGVGYVGLKLDFLNGSTVKTVIHNLFFEIAYNPTYPTYPTFYTFYSSKDGR
jgi:hypothetical protein